MRSVAIFYMPYTLPFRAFPESFIPRPSECQVTRPGKVTLPPKPGQLTDGLFDIFIQVKGPI